jgi:hypothetical protein
MEKSGGTGTQRKDQASPVNGITLPNGLVFSDRKCKGVL